MPTVKESSDEMNPPVLTVGVSLTPAPSQRTAGDYLALAVATCGVGFLPLAPGTWGSAVGVGLYLALVWVFGLAARWYISYGNSHDFLISGDAISYTFTAALLALIVIICVAGTWAATRAEKLLGKKDPGAVVVDEVAGQLIAFVFVPPGRWLWLIVVGFIAFRLFDIWKPYPIRRLESLGGGLGIMADDVLAGAYAAVLMSLLTSIYLWL
ncbi:MAG: phosphatidylglycerophosphatase A [Acidobacteria bacterium]|nr:phosphatidylglycerophosphatase A [Acidobacteriota bacterium]